MPAQPAPKNWHDEPWAQKISALPVPERKSLISAALAILAQGGSDGLESELAVYLECACGDDLEDSLYPPEECHQLPYAEEAGGRAET